MNGTETHHETVYVELSQRESDGIEVRLLWERGTDHLVVVVHNARSEEAIEVTARPDNALDVFRHPFAYAGRQTERRPLVDIEALLAA
jgi:hypothetical protein